MQQRGFNTVLVPLHVEAMDVPALLEVWRKVRPATTDLLRLAQRRGARVVAGRGMLDQQLERMAAFFGEAIRLMAPAGGSK